MGMSKISNIRELVNLWPTQAALAEDIREQCPGVKTTAGQVHKWAANGSIPSKYHHPLLLAGRDRGFELTAELIMELHAPKAEAA